MNFLERMLSARLSCLSPWDFDFSTNAAGGFPAPGSDFDSLCFTEEGTELARQMTIEKSDTLLGRPVFTGTLSGKNSHPGPESGNGHDQCSH